MHVLVTGGAGYVGSLLTALLLQRGVRVTVVDTLRFGGESLLGSWHHPGFRFVQADVTDEGTLAASWFREVHATVHLAALVGFPACKAAGRETAWCQNVEATRRVFEAGETAGVTRFVFASTYSNYGLSADGSAVTEDSPLHPQSLYAETKIAAERYLLERAPTARCAPIIYRFATLFGISPRTRFDLLVNQFVLEAVTTRRLLLYQAGHARAYVHVGDVCDAVRLALEACLPAVRGEIFNVGSESANFTKDEIVALVRRAVPGTAVELRNLAFDGDMRDIRVSCAKIRRVLGFEPRVTVEEGIREVRDAVTRGIIQEPQSHRYRNAQSPSLTAAEVSDLARR